jgi:hypothetical protein
VGYAFSVYAVDLKKLKPTKNKKLVVELRAKYEADFAEADRWFDREIVENGAPSRARALYQLVMGLPLQKSFGFQYAYALETLCRHHGARVGEVDLTWFASALDPLLKRARYPSTAKLLGKGERPMRLPMPDNFPELGMLSPAGCAAGIRAMTAVAPFAKGDGNAEMVIREVRLWCESAKAKKRGLMWFVY